MDLMAAKLRITTVLVGAAIAVLAAAIIMSVITYFFGVAISSSIILLILGAVLVMDVIQWFFSPYIIGYAYRLTEIRDNDPNYFWVSELVSKLAMSNNLRMPRVYIAEVNFPNAFAYSSPIAGKRIAITRPLLNLLDRQELEAVLAHELGHLRHRDVELLFAIGLIPTLMFYLAYGLLFSGNNRQQNGYGFLIAIALMVLSFLFNIMILGVNRMRESYADINAVHTAENGATHLQTALAKIVGQTGTRFRRRRTEASNSITSMLLFSDLNSAANGGHMELLRKWRTMKVSRISAIFSSHPHPARRIQMLERYRQSR